MYINKSSDRNIQVKLADLLGNYDSLNERPTDCPTDGR